MDTRDLSIFDQIKISKVAAKCSTLKERLESHGFIVRKFQVYICPDDSDLLRILPSHICGILTTVRFDEALLAGTINVAALVQ